MSISKREIDDARLYVGNEGRIGAALEDIIE